MRSSSLRHPVVTFVLLTYAFTWSVQVPIALFTSSQALQFVAVAVSAFGPLVAAAILVWQGSMRFGVWIRDMFSWQVSPRWYLTALLVPLAGVVAQTFVYALSFGKLDFALLPQQTMMWVGLFPVALLVTGGNEEVGWRGFMLPRLQRQYSALTAGLIVGIVWLVWHLPSDLLMTALGGGLTWSLERLLKRIAVIPLAILLTWLYNSTHGSVHIAMIFHASWNTMGGLVPAAPPPPGASSLRAILQGTRVGAMVLIALAVTLWYRRETLSASERHTGPHGRESDA